MLGGLLPRRHGGHGPRREPHPRGHPGTPIHLAGYLHGHSQGHLTGALKPEQSRAVASDFPNRTRDRLAGFGGRSGEDRSLELVLRIPGIRDGREAFESSPPEPAQVWFILHGQTPPRIRRCFLPLLPSVVNGLVDICTWISNKHLKQQASSGTLDLETCEPSFPKSSLVIHFFQCFQCF